MQQQQLSQPSNYWDFEKQGPGDNTFGLSIVTNANKSKNILYAKLNFYLAAFAFIPV